MKDLPNVTNLMNSSAINCTILHDFILASLPMTTQQQFCQTKDESHLNEPYMLLTSCIYPQMLQQYFQIALSDIQFQTIS